jgi:hypothetical protein
MVNTDKTAIRGPRVAGQYPGWDIGSRAYSRSELSCLGFHRVPIAGIDFVAAGKAGKHAPPVGPSLDSKKSYLPFLGRLCLIMPSSLLLLIHAISFGPSAPDLPPAFMHCCSLPQA